MKKTGNMVLVLIMTFVFCTCSTIKRLEKHDVMHVMVYDLDNKAVQGMRFTLDGADAGVSDIYGRLLLDFGKTADSKSHVLKAEKSGYSSIEDDISFIQSGVLYYKTGNAQQYLREAERLADEGDLIIALEHIKKAESLEKSDDILYLHSVLLYKGVKNDEALEIINKISDKDREEVKELILRIKEGKGRD